MKLKQDAENYAVVLKLWKRNDAKAQRIIGTTVGNSQLTHIVNCKSAKSKWDKLHSVFEKKSETSLLLLHQKFFSFSFENNEKIIVFISRLEELVQRLSDLGEQVSDNILIPKVIMSLTPEYNGLSSALESAEKAERTIANLRGRLMIEEERWISRGTIESTEALVAARSGFNKESSKQGIKFKKFNKNISKSNSKCYNCGKPGHWARNCKP